MKLSLVFFIVVLSAIVVLNEACGGGSKNTSPTPPPTSSSTSRTRPKKIHRHRIFSFAKVTTKPKVKSECRTPNVCLDKCGTDRYVLGRYNCTGLSYCCAPY